MHDLPLHVGGLSVHNNIILIETAFGDATHGVKGINPLIYNFVAVLNSKFGNDFFYRNVGVAAQFFHVFHEFVVIQIVWLVFGIVATVKFQWRHFVAFGLCGRRKVATPFAIQVNLGITVVSEFVSTD